MNTLLDGFLEALRGLDGARRALRLGVVAGPFAVAALVQLLILVALAGAFHPVLAPALLPLLRALGGDAALHYPMHLVLLPAIHEALYLVVLVLVAFPLYTRAIRHAVVACGLEASRRSGRRAPGDGVVLGLAFAVAAAGPALLAERFAQAAGPGTGAALLRVLGFTATAAALVHVVYAPVALVRWGGSAVTALRRGAAMARRRRAPTWTLVVAAMLVQLPISWLLARPDRVALRLRPETIVYLLGTATLLDVLTMAFVLLAAVALACERRGLSW